MHAQCSAASNSHPCHGSKVLKGDRDGATDPRAVQLSAWQQAKNERTTPTVHALTDTSGR